MGKPEIHFGNTYIHPSIYKYSTYTFSYRDTGIYNKKYILGFHPDSGTELLNLNFLSVEMVTVSFGLLKR